MGCEDILTVKGSTERVLVRADGAAEWSAVLRQGVPAGGELAMRAVVFAYHDMGITGLEALARAGEEVVHIFTHRNDPREKCWFGSVEAWARQHDVPVLTPVQIGNADWQRQISALKPDVLFSFYYRRLLPQGILAIPSRGAYNLHGSLLPDYRGRCPVNWVLIHGETTTGVTLHHMVDQADAGDIVGQKVVPIERTDTAQSLSRKLCDAGGNLLDELLPLIRLGKAPRRPQDLGRGSYFGGRRPEDGRIDWHWPAERIYNLVRALTDPYPGAFCEDLEGGKLLIWWATVNPVAGEGEGRPGDILIEGRRVLVQTGKGRIELCDVEGRQGRITGDAIVRYFNYGEGMRLP
jgi:methionyl-tRNA formyltransferase